MKEGGGGGGRRVLNITEVAQRLAALPAEELKAEILHALDAGGRTNPNPNPNPNPNSDPDPNPNAGGRTSPEGGSSKTGSVKGRGMFGGRATPSPPSSFASHLDRLDAPPAEAPLEVGGITLTLTLALALALALALTLALTLTLTRWVASPSPPASEYS